MLAAAREATAVSLVVQMAEHMAFTLDQMRGGAKLHAGRTAKQDHAVLTTETSVTWKQYKQAVTSRPPAMLCISKAAPHSVQLRHT